MALSCGDVVAAQRGLVLEAEMSYVMRGWRRDGAVVQKVVDSENAVRLTLSPIDGPKTHQSGVHKTIYQS